MERDAPPAAETHGTAGSREAFPRTAPLLCPHWGLKSTVKTTTVCTGFMSTEAMWPGLAKLLPTVKCFNRSGGSRQAWNNMKSFYKSEGGRSIGGEVSRSPRHPRSLFISSPCPSKRARSFTQSWK